MVKYSPESCPDGVKMLTEEAQGMWCGIANSVIEGGDTEMFAEARAWQAVKEAWEKDDTGNWIKKIPASAYTLDDPTHKITGIEIFAEGKWNGDEYSIADLDEMIKNFNQGVIKNVPLKVGHDPKQKVAGQPAVGIIERIYRSGQKLLADISNIPKTVAELIKKKAYNSVSAEIAWDVDWNGSIFTRLLTGVALLGAEIPAVNVLSEIPSIYNAKFSKVATFGLNADGNINMLETAKEDLEMEKIKELEAKIAELQKELDAQTAKVKEFQAAEVLAKEELEKKTVKDFTAKLIADKKILPAQQERIERSLIDADNSTKKEYSIGETKVEETSRDNLMRLYEGFEKLQLFSEQGRSEEHSAGDNAEKAISLAKKYESEKKIGFKDALLQVWKEHPEWEEKAKNIKS